jgi:hypothetical protein
MPEPNRHDALQPDAADVPAPTGALDGGDSPEAVAHGDLAPSDAFQKLASDVRVAVLVALYRAERDGDAAPSFAEVQDLVGSDSSARFAYHLRQLDGHFVRKTPNGYELTPAGRRAAKAVLSGTFTNNDGQRAS